MLWNTVNSAEDKHYSMVKRMESGSRLASARLWLQIGIIVLVSVPLAASFVLVTGDLFTRGPPAGTLTEVEYLFVVLAGAIGVLVAAIGTDNESAFNVARTRIAAYVIIGLAAAAGLVINVISIVQILRADVVGL